MTLNLSRVVSYLLLIILSGFLLLTSSTFAQEKKEATPEPPVTIDSYKLFWPLVPGRTEDGSFYFIKLIKEDVQGFFIFDDTQKADYAIKLGTKRVLESEKLFQDGKNDLAIKALERAGGQYKRAYEYTKSADSRGKLSSEKIDRARLINVKMLIDYLKTTSPGDAKPALDSVKDKADAILRDYLVRFRETRSHA